MVHQTIAGKLDQHRRQCLGLGVFGFVRHDTLSLREHSKILSQIPYKYFKDVFMIHTYRQKSQGWFQKYRHLPHFKWDLHIESVLSSNVLDILLNYGAVSEAHSQVMCTIVDTSGSETALYVTSPTRIYKFSSFNFIVNVSHSGVQLVLSVNFIIVFICSELITCFTLWGKTLQANQNFIIQIDYSGVAISSSLL